jgi:hypothetical protein
MRRTLLYRISLLTLALMVLAGLSAAWWHDLFDNRFANARKSRPLARVEPSAPIASEYDLIVAGTDPEGIAAALSAARSGLRVLLADGRGRTMLGGLLTCGGLNMLDLNYAPEQPRFLKTVVGPRFLNKGIFQEWYGMVEGSSFDTTTAANAFYKLVRDEPGIDLLMRVKNWKPLTRRAGGRIQVTGMELVREDGSVLRVRAGAVIDATQDGDIAAAAGAAFTFGREDIGEKNGMMASTLVFKMSGVTQERWEKLGSHPDAGMDRMSIWGYKDAARYNPSDPSKVRLRGLNIGRQNDGTILINAMQLFGVNPLDPGSVRRGLAVGRREAPRIAEFLKTAFPEFKDLKYAGTASELYIRESRHLIGEYRLTLADVMENRSHEDDIAYGSYPIDIQSTGRDSQGTVLMKPGQYGVPFRCLVPQGIDGLLVVGRSASYDTIPHGSARVVPLGMATGQAAGAAAKVAHDRGVTFRELSRSPALVAELRRLLVKQGVNLTVPKLPVPDYMRHQQYRGLLAAASMNLAYGGVRNDGWKLDSKTNVRRFCYAIRRIRHLHPERFRGGMLVPLSGIAEPAKQPLTLDDAACILLRAADGADAVACGDALGELLRRGWLTRPSLDTIADRSSLTNGDAYMLIRDFAEKALGLRFG